MMQVHQAYGPPNYNIYGAQLNKGQKGYVTDNLIMNRDRSNPLLSSPKLPDELTTPQKKENNNEKTLLKMISVPLGILGAGVLVTAAAASVFRGGLPKNLPKKLPVGELPPNIGTNTNLLSESELATYRFIRNPSTKSLLGAAAVYTFGAGASVLKNTVDGIKEIWVKQQQANINRNYQEGMIDVENRSFSGKKQIIRYMLNKNEKELGNFNKMQNVSFTGSRENDKNPEQPKINPSQLLIGALAIAGSGLLMVLSIKNIKRIGKDISSSVTDLRETFAGRLKNTEINPRPEELDNVANNISQQFINLDIVKPDEVKGILGQTALSDELQKAIFKKATTPYAKTHPSQGIDGKRTIFSIVNDASGFLYDFILEPNKIKGALFAGLASITGLSYVGTKFVEANKEVRVEKAKADIDLDMNDKLVRVQLKNFKTKKESAVEPLIRDYKDFAKCPKTPKDVLKTTYNGIFEEIKNGPPFVYD